MALSAALRRMGASFDSGALDHKVLNDLDLLALRRKGPKGHTWSGRRRKLKRSLQNHQRNVSPSRRHG